MGHHVVKGHHVIRHRANWDDDEYCKLFGHKVRMFGDGRACISCFRSLLECLETNLPVEYLGQGFEIAPGVFRSFVQKYRLNITEKEVLEDHKNKIYGVVIAGDTVAYNVRSLI